MDLVLPASDNNEAIHCSECAATMIITDAGISHHLDENGDVDFDADSDHVALDDSEFTVKTQDFTIVGIYADNGQTYIDSVAAVTPEIAIGMLPEECYPIAVFRGDATLIDAYDLPDW